MVYRCFSIPLDSLLFQGAKEANKCVSLNKAKLRQNGTTPTAVRISRRVYPSIKHSWTLCLASENKSPTLKNM